MMAFLENMVPVAFYPYTSSVRDRILEIEYTHNDAVHRLHLDLIAQFKEAGIECAMDNKCVFEFIDGCRLHVLV